MDIGLHNEKISTFLIDQLVQLGVDTFCIAPGSRSSALTLAAVQHPTAQKLVHFDERGLGFFAMGIAKGLRKPVAIITTSGTAVGNLMPAVMEASNDAVPLIVLTADRPAELRDCGANQACDQVRLFNNFVRFQTDLPMSDGSLPDNYVKSTIAQAVFLAQNPTAGPVHINCMYREPLFASQPVEQVSIDPCLWEKGEVVPSSAIIANWAGRLTDKKGVILVGAQPHDANVKAIFTLAEKLNWPIFADPLSQMHTRGSHSHLIAHCDALVRSGPPQPIDAVVQFGDRIVSKAIAEWLKKVAPPLYLHVAEHTQRHDPFSIVTHRLQASPEHFAHALARVVPDGEGPVMWKGEDDQVKELLASFFSDETTLSEPGAVRRVGSYLKPEVGLFLANSMPIRDANLFLAPDHPIGPVFGNRGVSGIDGNIATVAGIAHGLRKPLIAVLGDLTFLHDLNSLALVKSSLYPVCLVVINNRGGGIFSFLPIAQKQDVFEKFWATAHDYSFAQAAPLFNISYCQPTGIDDLENALHIFSTNKTSMLIEVCTDREANFQLHQQLTEKIKTCLNSIACPL